MISSRLFFAIVLSLATIMSGGLSILASADALIPQQEELVWQPSWWTEPGQERKPQDGENPLFLPFIALSDSTPESGWHYFVSEIITGSASCASTGFAGVVRDDAGVPKAGVQVKVWAAESGQDSYLSEPTGGDGVWRVVIDDSQPVAGRWKLAVVNSQQEPISPVIGQVAYQDDPSAVEAPGIPTHDDCVNGHQWLTVGFEQRQEFPEFTVASVRFISCRDNHFDHNIRLWVIDVEGNGIRYIPVLFWEENGFGDGLLTGTDPFKPPGYLDYPIWERQTWSTEILTGTTDTSYPVSSETPPILEDCSGNAWGHYSYEIVFQRRDLP
ncbi:MAG: hypothetical protein U9R25_19275 [Chloroflexota bacterium]|nr:hypothetical protein [Chloroflexota bacterium]